MVNRTGIDSNLFFGFFFPPNNQWILLGMLWTRKLHEAFLNFKLKLFRIGKKKLIFNLLRVDISRISRTIGYFNSFFNFIFNFFQLEELAANKGWLRALRLGLSLILQSSRGKKKKKALLEENSTDRKERKNNSIFWFYWIGKWCWWSQSSKWDPSSPNSIGLNRNYALI